MIGRHMMGDKWMQMQTVKEPDITSQQWYKGVHTPVKKELRAHNSLGFSMFFM